VERDIDAIKIGDRFRRDMGDIDALAETIKSEGLLHPIVIRPDNLLIAGERRLAACRKLGWPKVPVTVVDLQKIVRGEYAENFFRKAFAPSEMVAIQKAIRPKEVAAAQERKAEGQKAGASAGGKAGGKGRKQPSGKVSTKAKPGKKSRDEVAKAVGVSGRTLEKMQAITDAAESDPERYGGLIAQMDKSGKADGAYKKLKAAQRKEEIAAAAVTAQLDADKVTLHPAACADILKLIPAASVDWVVTDPPYPEEFLQCFTDLSIAAAHALKPGGSLLCMSGEAYLPEVIRRLDERLSYHWTIAYLTPGGQAVQIFPRKVNSFWKPILWYVKGKFDGDWIGDVTKSDMNDNDKERHKWGQSESGMRDLMSRFVRPGQTVLDPFMGAGTTGVVSLALSAKFIGFDIDKDAFAEAKARLGQ
jgi:hypothetical protein